jgi:putative ABC transport system permease protein
MSVLYRWFTLRHLAGEAPRTILTLIGVALGVGMFVSIRLASTSALASFSDTVDAVAGTANLQITSDTDGFDERVYLTARSAEGVRAASPVIEQYVAGRAGGPLPLDAAGTPGRERRAGYDETLLMLGLDVLGEAPFERYRPAAADSGSPLAFIADPRGVAITSAFADRTHLGIGDTLTVLSAGRPVALNVRQILASESFEQAYGGHVIVLDIGVAQTLFHRVGRLDRIDLIADPARVDAIAMSLREQLPPVVQVTTPAGRTRQVESMVRAFQLNLTALSFIAVFVAGFLVFNAVAMTVLRRRREIGILRGLGVTRGELLRQFVTEGLFFGVAGGALGLVLGTLFARLTLGAISRTLSDLYLIRHASQLTPDPATYGLGMAIGVGVALLAAFAPALEAASTPPGHTMRQGTLIEARRIPISRWSWLGVALLLASAASAWWTVTDRHPEGGFVAAFLALGGFSCLAPGFTLALVAWLARPIRALFGIEGLLGARYLRDAIARTSVVIAAVMVSVGMMVALSIMVGSFRRTVDVWIGQSVRGDLYVEPVGHRLNLGSTVLPPALVDSIRALPGVAAVDSYRGARVPIGDRVSFVAGVDFEVQARHGRLQFMRGMAPEILERARAGGGVIVSESFHHHQRVAAGDTIELATPSGLARLLVEGVYYDYTSDAGAVLMHRDLYARLWQDDRTESLALYLDPGVSVDATRLAVLARAGDTLLDVVPNQTLRARVLTVFDQTFQITYGLQIIAILVSVLGVIAALTAMILQRGREIGVLRAIGARRAQVRRMVLVESGLIGLAGALLGSVCGIALSLILVHIIHRQFFGWTIRLTIEPGIFVQTLLLMVGAAVLAGIGPARMAATRVAAEAMRME